MTKSQTVLRFAEELASKGFLTIFFVNQFIHQILKFDLILHSIYLKSLSREYAQIMPTSMYTDIGWICTTESLRHRQI